MALCTYNGARYLRQQVESLFGQTRLPDEVVVVDDASTDGTPQLLAELAEEAPVPVEIRENPSPVGHRRNFERAITACSGEVVFLCDQDDVWLPGKIEEMLGPLSEDGVGIVYCDAVVTDAELAPVGGTVFSRQRELGLDRPRDALRLVRGVGIPGCTLAFRACLTEALRPFSARWGHDLWIVLVGAALSRLVPVPRVLMQYRRHPGSAGPSRLIDAGTADRVRDGVAGRGQDVYERDLAKWDEVVERLEALAAGADVRQPDRLESFLSEYRRRLEFARFRADVHRRPRRARLAPVARRAVAGEYRRYLRPVAGPAKDVLL